jgi:23S rRNA (adenine2503-C2)-methyltransferase
VLNLRDLDLAATAVALAPFGVDERLARKVFAHVHSRCDRVGHGAPSLDGLRVLPLPVRRALAPELVWPDLEVIERRRAADGFVKYLFRLADGPEIEAVRIPLPDPADTRALKERRRRGEVAGLVALPTAKYTVCVSSQAGCALECDFCATGRLGGIRSLETWEILAQVRRIAIEADHPVRGVVFMGMGEPLLNYDNVVRAASILAHPAGGAISADAISISTAGVVPMIRRFTAEGHRFRLVFSLGAPTSAARLPLMPIEKRWPLPDLMAAVRAYAAATNERVTLAYVAIGGVGGNLARAHARQLGELCVGLKVKVNLIDVSDDAGKYLPPSPAELQGFRDELSAVGIPVVRRYSGGQDIGAGCGTLAGSRVGGTLVELRLPGTDGGVTRAGT